MKFVVSSSLLLKHLQKAGGAISSNPVMAILEDFQFTIRDSQLEILGTDLQTSVSTTLDIQAEEDMTFVVPAKLLIDTLKATPEQPIEIEYDQEARRAILSSSVGKYQMATHPVDEFPALPEEENTNTISLPSHVLERAFTNTIFATSNDEARIAMTGIYVKLEAGKIVFVSTDAHKLVEYSYEHEGIDVEGSFILPKKSVQLLKGILPTEGEIEISFNQQHAFFAYPNTAVACRLLNAEYPDYNAVIPRHNELELSVNRNDFYNSLRRISIFANKSTYQVALALHEDSLTVRAQDLDYSNDATEQLACFYKGDSMRIGFNGKFLMEIAHVLESEEVVMKIHNPNQAVLIYPSENVDGESIVMLLMPIMVQHMD